ncbi:MAG TPA: ComF family protein [Roseiarcus sp.]|nr:ComF family protein [Roseiarcus sp.]
MDATPAPPWRARAAGWLNAGRRAALDIVFPPSCLSCRAAVAETNALCGRCWGAMRFIERPFCDRLGLPFEHEMGEGVLSAQAVDNPPVFQRARAVVLFAEGPARRLVHRLKYSDRMELARPLGAWMARAGADVLADADALAPVPLHYTRLWRRQFNQSAALARVIGGLAGKPVELGLVERVRSTRSQVGLSRAERAQNLQGAFRCPETAPLRGRRIVLVDDVLTSGATANATARALLRGGAKAVDVLVFARVAK